MVIVIIKVNICDFSFCPVLLPDWLFLPDFLLACLRLLLSEFRRLALFGLFLACFFLRISCCGLSCRWRAWLTWEAVWWVLERSGVWRGLVLWRRWRLVRSLFLTWRLLRRPAGVWRGLAGGGWRDVPFASSACKNYSAFYLIYCIFEACCEGFWYRCSLMTFQDLSIYWLRLMICCSDLKIYFIKYWSQLGR